MMLTIFVASFLLLGKTQGSQNIPQHCFRRSSDFSIKKIASYKDASSLCQSLGGHLTSLHSAEENEFVMSFLKSGGHSRGWLGVKFDEEDFLKSEVRRWEDKSLLTFTNWMESSITPGCGSLSSEGYWQISNCEQLMAYVCKLSNQDCRMEEGNVAHRRRRHAKHGSNTHEILNPHSGLYNRLKNNEFHDNHQQPQPPPELVDHSHKFAQSHILQPESELTDQLDDSGQSTSIQVHSIASHSNPDQAPLTASTLTPVDLISSHPTTAQKLGSPASPTVSPSVNVTQPLELEEPSSESSIASQEPGTSESTSTVTHSTQGCEKDEIAYGGFCYNINPDHATWAGAMQLCWTHGGRLAILDDRLTAEHLGSLSNTTFLAWFGLSWSNTSHNFKWLTGQPLNSSNWNHLQGGDVGNHNDCVMIQLGEKMHAGTWFKDDCTNHHRYICEFTNHAGPTTTIPTTTTTTPTTSVTTTITTTTPSTTTTSTTTTTTTTKPIPACANGWMKKIDHCYKLFSELQSWDVAERICHTYGAHLLSISNNEEESLLRWMLTIERGRYLPGPSWVGLKMGLNLEHDWLDDSNFTSLDWSHDEPNINDGQELCVRVKHQYFEFSTAACATTLPFICEAPEGMSSTTLAPPTSAPDVLCQDHNSTQNNSPWSLYNNFCYKFVGTALTWWDSQVKCREEGGELASIHSLEENYWIRSKLSGLDVDIAWLGGRALEDSGYSWLDDTPFDFINWGKREPNNIMGQEECVGITRREGYWNDQNCAMAEGRVCKRPHGEFHPPVRPTQPPQGYCPQGWIYTGTKCFKIFTELRNIQTAIAFCKNLSSGGNLASIHTPIEQAYLTSAMSTVNDSVWLGLRNHNLQNYWMDQTVMTFTNWASGGPSSTMGSTPQCVEMLPFHEAGLWNYKSCSGLHGYFCQQSLDSNITHVTWRASCDAPLDQYTNHAGQCYRIITTPAAWKDAEEMCQSEGSHLVSILSMSEAATIWVLMVESDLEDTWLGLHYLQEREVFKWSSGWSALYTQWGAGEPSLKDSLHQCTKMNATDGLWYTDNCDQAKSFVCKFQNEAVPTPDTPMDGSCPEYWQDFGGSFCYAIFPKKRPWKDANMRCLRENGDLVSIHTEEENTLIQKAAHFIKDTVWIGLLQKRNNYGWSDGTGFDFMMLGHLEPTEGGERCVEMYVSTGKWNDIHCSSIRPFMCKTAKIPPNVTEASDIRRVTSEELRLQHLTAAGTAGITLAIVLLVLLALVAGYTFRKRKMMPPKIDGGYSFDNALYSADESRTCEVVDEIALHFYHNDPVDTDI